MTYSAGWFQDAGWPWSVGTAVESMTPGEQATFTFNGTSISWSDYRGPDARTARVYLDGSFAGEVDTYSPTYGDQASVFTKTGLADASHTLTFEVTGRKNAASMNAWIVVDAFDVRP